MTYVVPSNEHPDNVPFRKTRKLMKVSLLAAYSERKAGPTYKIEARKIAIRRHEETHGSPADNRKGWEDISVFP
jgi:hypothetical protein